MEQDSNLRRQCHQIYSLAPLATWVSTRVESPRVGSSTSPHRAGGESRTHNRRFTKPVLCRLSYASDQQAVKFPDYIAGVPRCKAFRDRREKPPAPPVPDERDRDPAGSRETSASRGRTVGRTQALAAHRAEMNLIPRPGPSARARFSDSRHSLPFDAAERVQVRRVGRRRPTGVQTIGSCHHQAGTASTSSTWSAARSVNGPPARVRPGPCPRSSAEGGATFRRSDGCRGSRSGGRCAGPSGFLAIARQSAAASRASISYCPVSRSITMNSPRCAGSTRARRSRS